MTGIDQLLDSVEWVETGATDDSSGLPYATHVGVLRVLGAELGVYRLSDGRRIIDAEDLEDFFSSPEAAA